MNEQPIGYEECVATSGKLIALYRQPPEAFAGLNADERKVLEAARLLKTEKKEQTGKYRDPTATQISGVLGGSFTPDKVQVMLRKINARGLLQIYKPDEKKKEQPMTTTIMSTTTPPPTVSVTREAPTIYGHSTQDMFQRILDDYMAMLQSAAKEGDRVTYTYAVKQLADDTFTGMYFNSRPKAGTK